MLLVSLWGGLWPPWVSSTWASTSSCSWWLASMSTWAWSPSIQIGYVILLSDKSFHLRLSLCHHNEWLMLQKKICNITDTMLLQKKNETSYFMNTLAHSAIQFFESNIWKRLVEINIQDEDLLNTYYDFLCDHPKWSNSLTYLLNEEWESLWR